MSERKSVIITFKPKDQRPDRQIDKLEIVRRALTKGTRAHFFDATTLAKGAGRLQVGLRGAAAGAVQPAR